MAGFESDSYYDSVPSLGEYTSEKTPANGNTWRIYRFVAGGAYVDDAHVCLVWDYGGAGEIILRASHGDADLPVHHDIVGDGTKKLAIVLINDTAAERVLGASWEAKII